MELSEEEKKAINFIKEVIELWLDKDKSYVFMTDYEKENLKIILNLIDKQQKEIEDMREELQMYVDIGNNNLHNYISKDKIRDYKKAVEWKRQQEIENLGMSMLGSAIDVLNKLLEEN